MENFGEYVEKEFKTEHRQCSVSVCGVSREITPQCIALCQCVECLKATVKKLGDR